MSTCRRVRIPRRGCPATAASASIVHEPEASAAATRQQRSSSDRSLAQLAMISAGGSTRTPSITSNSPTDRRRIVIRPCRRTRCRAECAAKTGRSRGTGGSHHPWSRAAVTCVQRASGGSTSCHASSSSRNGSPPGVVRHRTPRVTGRHDAGTLSPRTVRRTAVSSAAPSPRPSSTRPPCPADAPLGPALTRSVDNSPSNGQLEAFRAGPSPFQLPTRCRGCVRLGAWPSRVGQHDGVGLR